MQIPPEKIDEVLERIDIVSLVSRHVELKKSGHSFKGLCPFHGEKTPSFHVNPERRSFKCFGCEAGGDAISFLQRITGRSFIETVKELANEAGVSIEQRNDPAARELAHLREVNEFARRFFEETLWSSPHAKAGRDHLKQRQVSQEIGRLFGLGYAVNAWNELSTRFVKEGILEWGARVGLCAPRRQAEGHYDMFRGRLMIPIRTQEGRTVAFGGRLIEETARDKAASPKYLNSRESPVYRKGEMLYALDLAKEEIRRTKTAILVEGYFDVIGLFGVGIRNTVALCSTALTAAHLSLLTRIGAEELVLLLDGDSAGQKAVERLAAPLIASGIRARVATLPAGDDPDTFALREGKQAMDTLIGSAPALSAHVLERALPRDRSANVEEKMAALTKLKPLLEAMQPGMAKTLFVSQLAEHLGVTETQVHAHLRHEALHSRPKPKVDGAISPKNPNRPSTNLGASPVNRLSPNEELFVALLIAEPDMRKRPEARFLDEIRSIELRILLENEMPANELSSLPEHLRLPIQRRLNEIEQTLNDQEMRHKALSDSSSKIRLLRIEERQAEKRAEIEHAIAQGASDEEIERLQLEHMQLAELRRQLRERAHSTPFH